MNVFARHWNVLVESFRNESERRKTAKQFDETDFLPAALEVLETPPKPLGRIILWMLLSFLFIALVWSIFGHIDVVASAQGKVIPRGRVRIIQTADLGIVRAIHVVDGQSIRAGEPLIVLDPTATDADATQARESMFVAELDRARAKALVDSSTSGRPGFAAPSTMPREFAAVQESLVAARIAEHRTAIQALREEGAQRESDLAMVTAEVAKLEQQVPLAESQLNGMEELDKQGLVPRMKVSEIKERVVGLRQDLVIRREEMIKTRSALSGIKSQIAKLQSEFEAKSLDALS